ncbi:leucine-rich repeat protein, partial [Parabacteroides sp.]
DKLTIGDNKALKLTKLTLPNEVKDKSGKTYTITAIASSAFEKTALTGIKLPSTLQEIGSYAFHGTTQLTSIEIPASVKKIGVDAFMDSGLTSVTFVEGDNLKEIGEEAFYGIQLERLSIPKGVETIVKGAFGGCKKLKSVTIPESVTTIGARVFKGCEILTDVTYLGKTEPTIGDKAFNLDDENAIVPGRKVTIPNGEGDLNTDWHYEKWGVEKQSDLIFAGWEYDSAAKTLTMDKTVINNVTADGKKLTIGENSALNLSELSLPDSAKDKNAYAITAIASGAFKQNAKLTKITLPATVTKIGDNAFAETITELHLLHETPDNLEMHVSGLNKSSCVVYVPKDKLKNFHTTDPYWNWNGFSYILEEGGEMVAIKYEDKDGNAWAPDKSLLSEGSLFATQAPVGQTFVYVLNFASEDSSLVFKSKDDPTPNVFTSKNDTILTLATNEKKDWTLTVSVLRPIKENTVTDAIVIKSDNEYEKDGEDDSYNGTITATTTPKLTIGVEGETKEINITMKEVKVEKADETEGETTVQSGTTATLTLEGTNNLGTLKNDGTLTLTATDRTKIKLPGIKITNNKVFRDSTGIITEVEGTALLKVNAIPSQPVETGSTVTLKAKVTSNAGMKMDYKWLRLGNDGKWTDYPSAPAPAANFSMRAATTTEEYENELTVKAEDKGEFRCEITAATTDESSITMLTVFTAVTLNEPTPDPVTYSVILPEVEGAKTDPQANTYWITEGDSFSFTLTLDADYDQSKPVVKAGDKVIEPNADGKYVIESIYKNITISITGIEKNTTVGNAEVETSEVKVWSDNGVLHIYTPVPARVRIVNFIGSPVKDLGTVNGDTQTTLPKGSYIIVIGDSTKKIAL